MTKEKLFAIAGTVWGLVGAFLIIRGIGLFELAVLKQGSSNQSVWIASGTALMIGGFKGKFVLSKTARRNKNRISRIEGPLKAHHVYAKWFYLMIAGMMGLGILLRTYNELLGGYVVVGAIYVGIGLALMVSSLVYWKADADSVSEETG